MKAIALHTDTKSAYCTLSKSDSSCLAGTSNQEWIDYSTNPSRFTIESNGNETVIRGDAQDTDGSLIVKDTLIVKYAKPLHSALKFDSAASQVVDETSSLTRIIQAEDGYANLRSLPSTEGIVLAKIPNGTSANILRQQTNSSEQLWYKVQVNGQLGWIFSDLLKPNLATSTAVTPEPVINPSFLAPEEYRLKSEISFETNHKSRKGRKRRK
ncbi:SH3 domain-containing protein [Tolypothrix sp. VBCCA 56010]|uniref:SH3 domain-containing protein n=1 Tax=Tolypothrix sp. VBCCA 56010 TaxID=3137731 RepID=UPI003D7EFE0D